MKRNKKIGFEINKNKNKNKKESVDEVVRLISQQMRKSMHVDKKRIAVESD